MLKTHPQTISFADIMAEELAAKLQQEEEDADQAFWKAQSADHQFYSPLTQEIPDDEEEQLRMVLELSAREAEETKKYIPEDYETIEEESLPKRPPSPVHKSKLQSEEQDYLYALQLQSTLEAQEYVQYLQQKERSVKDSLSKVTISYDNQLPSYLQDTYEKEDEYYSDEEDEEFENEGYTNDQVNPNEIIGMKPYHQTTKLTGRQPAKEVITKHDLLMDGLKNVSKLETMVEAGDMENVALSAPVYNSLQVNVRRTEAHKTRVRGNKADISTQDQVLDQRTRVALLQLLNAEALGELHGIVNTGKEANVYHGKSLPDEETGEVKEYAIKIFKTTLNEFKNRADYIEGEFRFRHKLSKQNPRKLIKLWAEKETRNLKRLYGNGIPCPEPIHLRDNIIVMSFLGKNGFPAPSLKDANLSSSDWFKVYVQTILLMRKMFHECKLIHADLSEYNLLYYKHKVWVIDVSQAIEHDHPRSLEFLRKDCLAISTFFAKKGVEPCLTSRQLFDFVTDINIESGKEESYLRGLVKENNQDLDESQKNEDIILNNIFHSQNTYIPRTLNDVKHPIDQPKEVFHEAVTGLKDKPSE